MTAATLLPNGDSSTQRGSLGQKFTVQAEGAVFEVAVHELVSLGKPSPDWSTPEDGVIPGAAWHGVAWRASFTVKWVSGAVSPTKLISLLGWEAGFKKGEEPGADNTYQSKLTGVDALDDQEIGFLLGSVHVGQEVDGYTYFDVDKEPITTVDLVHVDSPPRPPLAVWAAS
ncbi:hypothetical protein [Segniliparus rotundus]|uniref:hypothetical protein n=1 Tax=Segniliparus rotundus TaxID=286802 RepID=UPI0011D156CE|nr:hypothetical protein [Segniliparus rotundus]